MAPTVIRYSLIHICFITGKLYNIYYIQQMTQLFEINVKLSENQKKNLSAAYHKKGNDCSKAYEELSLWE